MRGLFGSDVPIAVPAAAEVADVLVVPLWIVSPAAHAAISTVIAVGDEAVTAPERDEFRNPVVPAIACESRSSCSFVTMSDVKARLINAPSQSSRRRTR